MKIPTFIMQDPKLLATYKFANAAHSAVEQVRKYTGEAYIVHPVDVADICNSTAIKEGFDDDRRIRIIQAALLHDTIEDTEATYNEIETEFGPEVRDLVFWCTDVTSTPQGNRRVRKELERLRLVHAPSDAKFIKMADFISNTRSIVDHDIGFATTYLNEKQAVLDAFSHLLPSNGYIVRADTVPNKRMLDLARKSLLEGRDKISKV